MLASASDIVEDQSSSGPAVVQSLYDRYRAAYELGKQHLPVGGPLLSLTEWAASTSICIASFGQLDLQAVDEGLIGPHVIRGLDDILGGLFYSFSASSLQEKAAIASSTEDETAAAAPAQQALTKLCASCGKSSNTLKYCNGCKCVWYCDKDCQMRHRREHKNDCKLIEKELAKRGGKLRLGTERDLGPLPELSPREECQICMRAMPLHEKLLFYFPCCGKTVCGGCEYQHEMKRREQVVPPSCAFCRTAQVESAEEDLARTRKRAELKDPHAVYNMAVAYGTGRRGLPLDMAKCHDLLHQAAGLGYVHAQYQLGLYHHFGNRGLERSEGKALEYFKVAAEGGHILARHSVGCMAHANGDILATMRHLRVAASGGYLRSKADLMRCFKDGLFHHSDLAATLQAMYLARADMRSEGRDKFIERLKEIGEYDEECDL